LVAEFEDLQVRSRRAGIVAVLADHLRQRRASDVLPSGPWLVRFVEEYSGGPARTRQATECTVAFVVWFGKCTEQGDFTKEAARSVAGFGEVDLASGQSLPDDIFDMHKISGRGPVATSAVVLGLFILHRDTICFFGEGIHPILAVKSN